VPPGTDVTSRVEEIIYVALAPTRHREDQARTVEQAMSQLRAAARQSELESRVRSQAMKVVLQLPEHASNSEMFRDASAIVREANALFDHAQKVDQQLSWVCPQLPFGASIGDREDAQALARRALMALPQGASDHQLREAMQMAIAPVAGRIEAGKAQEQRAVQERNHRSRIDAKVTFLYLPSGATAEERAIAARNVRSALEKLPPTASYGEVEAETEKQLAPIKSAIQAREQAESAAEEAKRAMRQRSADAERGADAALSSVEAYLAEYFDFDSKLDLWAEAGELKSRLRPRLIQMIQDGKLLNETHIERWLRGQVENS
jgi:hypothetical protein